MGFALIAGLGLERKSFVFFLIINRVTFTGLSVKTQELTLEPREGVDR